METTAPIEKPFYRFVGAAIDDGLWFALFGYFVAYVLSPTDASAEVYGLSVIVFASLWLNYFTFCETRWGMTMGKRVLGLRVLADDGTKAGFGACSIRNVLRPIDYLLIGPIMIAASDRHQRLGDKLGHTIVVKERQPYVPDSQKRAASAPVPPEGEEDIPLTEREHKPLAATPAPVAAAPGAGEKKTGSGFPYVTWSLRTTISGLLAGLFLAVFIAPLLVLPFDPDLEDLGAILTAQALLTAALIGTAIYIARRPEPLADLRTALGRLGWRSFKPVALAQMLGVLFCFYVVIALYSQLITQPNQEDIASDLGLDRGVLLASIAVFLICVVAPIAEETFFRGFLYGGLRGRLSQIPAASASGLVFGLVHAPTGLTTVIPLAVLGIGLALLYEWTGSIWPGIIAHAINNSLALAAS